jgi:hypothetical protein
MFELLMVAYAAALNQNLYPNAHLTPGCTNPKITQATIRSTICTAGSTRDARNVTEATKKQVYQNYGLDYKSHHGQFEVDHFISLELGGCNDVSNLWPEPFDYRLNGEQLGARSKDRVETHLKKEICEGTVTLAEAQAVIKRDWVKCYHAILSGKECHDLP